MICNSLGCLNTAEFTVQWSDSRPVDACGECATIAEALAKELKQPIVIKELRYESSRESQGNSQGAKGEVY